MTYGEIPTAAKMQRWFDSEKPKGEVHTLGNDAIAIDQSQEMRNQANAVVGVWRELEKANGKLESIDASLERIADALEARI